MKSLVIFALFVICSFSLYSGPKLNEDLYKEISSRNKRVCYVTTYIKYMTTFPPYAAKNGFKAGKHYWLLIQPVSLPVITKKTDEMNELIPNLKKGTKVKVFGKIKKFRVSAKNTMLPSYYLDLDEIQIIEEPKKDIDVDDNDKRKDQVVPDRPRRRPFRRR